MGVPTRSCLACRRRDDKTALVRLAIADHTIVFDPSADLPGRGAYLCQRQSCLDAALAKGSIRLRRALRAGATVTADETAIRAAQQRTIRVHEDESGSSRSE